jgi:hypothetical protein
MYKTEWYGDLDTTTNDDYSTRFVYVGDEFVGLSVGVSEDTLFGILGDFCNDSGDEENTMYTTVERIETYCKKYGYKYSFGLDVYVD